MKLTYFIFAISFAILSLWAKKRSYDKLHDAYHNNDSYGQGLDYQKSKDYTTLVKVSIILSFLCLLILGLS